MSLLAATTALAPARAAEPVSLGPFRIDATEVSVAAFAAFADRAGLRTAAEQAGGGFEFAGGWVRRPGWTFRAPFGAPDGGDSPAVHVTWDEALAYCRARGGRLPTFAEWRHAAYTEARERPTGGFVRGQTYRYPVGVEPAGMNTSGDDPWPRLAPVGRTRAGVNGLYDMGANAWEWVADRRGAEALTAGGSWWYGPTQTRAEGAQWKAADFAAVYIGFRCAYDAR